MMKENAYKSDMEPFVRGEMLFIAIPSVTGITATVLYMKQGMKF